jgi:hypothetical protein
MPGKPQTYMHGICMHICRPYMQSIYAGKYAMDLPPLPFFSQVSPAFIIE